MNYFKVIVKRFIMRSTVEEKILAIQDRKSVRVDPEVTNLLCISETLL